jgi:hypothetical protein
MQKNVPKAEVWHLGFKAKIVDKFDSSTIKNQLQITYPEYNWIFKLNYKKLIEFFSSIVAEEIPIDQKQETKLEPKSSNKQESKTKEKEKK